MKQKVRHFQPDELNRVFITDSAGELDNCNGIYNAIQSPNAKVDTLLS